MAEIQAFSMPFCGHVISRLQSFIEAFWLSPSSNITEPPKVSVTPQLLDGERVIDAISRLRGEIYRAKGELAHIKAAPLPADEICYGIMDAVDRMAEQGRPRLSVEGTKVRLSWPDEVEFSVPGQGAHSAPAGSATRLMCWLHHDLVIKRLITGIVDDPNAIPAAERPGRLQAVEERLFGLEVQEEHWVAQALGAGLECHRRADANPWCVLGYGLALEAPVVAAEAAE